MLRKLTAAAVLGVLTTGAIAQDDSTNKKSLTVSGFLDTYYKYDFANSGMNNYTSFTNSHNSFELGMASVKLEAGIGKVTGVIDLGFGTRAKEFAYNDEGITQAIKQLYATYAVTDNFSITAGSWATHVGYEVLDAPVNRNYSMSYMFSYGPFSHTGVKADYNFGNSGVMLGVANTTDFRTTDFGPKMLLAQFRTASANEKFALYANYVGGKTSDMSKMNQFDLVATLGITDNFSIGYNGTVASFKEKNDEDKYDDANRWWGSALYFNLDFSEKFGLTYRAEYFDDKKQLNVFGGAVEGGNVFANTLSADIRLGNFTIIPEFRLDNGSQMIYVDKDGAGSKSAANFLVAGIFSF